MYCLVRELVSMHMKQQGSYICRQLSYHSCSFRILEANTPAYQLEVYDKASLLWIRIFSLIDQGIRNGNLLSYFPESKHGRDNDDNDDSDSDLDEDEEFAMDDPSYADQQPLKVPASKSKASAAIYRYFWSKQIITSI